MPLMGSFYVGTSGLQTSQNALNTTAHNLSNIDAPGYTRQQVVQANKYYNKIGNAYISSQQVGLGVSYAKVRQVRDYFLDKSYRLEAGRSAFYENSYNVATEIETLFGEMEGVQFQESMQDLWNTVQELSKDPSNATNQGLFVSKAATFVERAQAVYNGLSSYQDTLNSQIMDTVDQINEYGQRIYDLNIKIMGIEAGGQEEANDLRDERNLILDNLASLCNITASEDMFGAVTVSVEGVDFVTRSYVMEMAAIKDPNSKAGYCQVVWPQNKNAEVFDMTRRICSDYNTDVGGLKGLLLLRGTDKGTYLDIPVEPKEADFTDGAGVLDKTAYDAACKQYEKDVDTYNKTVNKCLIQNTMAEFDKLINGIVTGINDILNPVVTDAGGVESTQGISVFLRTNVDEQKTTDVPTAVDVTQPITYWTTTNLRVNPLLLQQYSYLGSNRYETTSGEVKYTTGFTTKDGKEDHSKSDALVALFNNEFGTLNPNVKSAANFVGYYNNLVGDIAITGNVYKNMSENQASTVDSIDAARQQVVGVSDNEELTNMIKFQNAYNAASRYINSINDMLGTLIQTMAV